MFRLLCNGLLQIAFRHLFGFVGNQARDLGCRFPCCIRAMSSGAFRLVKSCAVIFMIAFLSD
jgi:hypothetical protein